MLVQNGYKIQLIINPNLSEINFMVFRLNVIASLYIKMLFLN